MSELDLTIVIPTYNSISKMAETLESLDKTLDLMQGEAIFVDDCSTDGTYERLLQLAEQREDWHVLRMQQNSGSAGAPRNKGIEQAQGNWIYFLDSDDVLEPRAIADALNCATKHNYDVVRTSLKVRMGGGRERVVDTIPKWDAIRDPVAKIRAITKHQSLTCSSFVKRSVIMDSGIRFDENRRIGEDIKFMSEVLLNSQHIGYRARPARTYVINSTGQQSVTQSLSSRQFADFVQSWNEVENNLSELGISFVAEHGFSTVQYALRQFVWFRSEDLKPSAFELFSSFCQKHKASLRSFPFESRYRELVDAALSGDYEAFSKAVKLRVLIAGHDLKFMRAIKHRLQESYHVEVDRWNGLNEHDENESLALLEWADFVWVEWLLGASVWYSKHIRDDQRMVVRAHSSEVAADYGLQINQEKVSAVISIAPHVMGDLSDRFDIPREKFWLIPNALNTDSYILGEYTHERLNKVAIVDAVPSLEGLEKYLELIASLRLEFPKLELHVYGKELSDSAPGRDSTGKANEATDFQQYINQQGLEDRVIWHEGIDAKPALSEVAVVIPMSNSEVGQVVMAEAFFSGALGLSLGWRGFEQGFPRDWVFSDIEAMKAGLRGILSGSIDLEATSADGRILMSELYSIDSVWPYVDELMKSVRT